MIKGYLRIFVLKELSAEPKNGYALIKAIGAQAGKRPSPGSVYPLLSDLSKKGLIKSRAEGRSKIYSITLKGRKVITKLLTKKQEVFASHVKLLKAIDEVTGVKGFIPKRSDICRTHDKNNTFLKNIDLIYAIRDCLLNIISCKNKHNKRKEQQVRKILKRTRDDLRKVERTKGNA